jgi:ATP-dependent helicase Lhr and Lhr-like helicase
MNDRHKAFSGDNVGRQLRRRAAARAAPAEKKPRRGAPATQCFSPEAWLESRGWTPLDFQRETWDAIARGENGLLHATTGSGKTYAVWLGALAAFAPKPGQGLRVLWVTPMRALAADTARALALPLADLGLAWEVGVRTGDTAPAERARQRERLPEALVTTPESLSLLLARDDAPGLFGALEMVVVDEWHELLGSKRGVQTQLALARLAQRKPLVWGLSATLGDLDLAARALFSEGRILSGHTAKALVVDTLVPESIERFPWGGHLGMRQLPGVLREIEAAASTLVFCNVRSACELWYQAILKARPQWAGSIALHHGSLDAAQREWVELGLKEGRLKAVVCTSSLDLGVDFLPVERVLQIGSAKGIARLLQRAGRSGHAPGRVSRVTLVPTNALELVEAAAVRRGVEAGRIESRPAPSKPIDVLVQHLVTCALGGGFREAELYAEVRQAHAYRDLTRAEWEWALDFVSHGGASLYAYPEHHRIAPDANGVHRVPRAAIATRHRMSIGTIVGSATMQVQFCGGKRIGAIEETFVAALRAGEAFLFGGRRLELVRVHEMTAYVRLAGARKAAVPRWDGSRMAFSGEFADCMLEVLAAAGRGVYEDAEVAAVRPLLDLQQRWSALPAPGRLVMETVRTREGHHLFCYPFGGRTAQTGLAALVAWRAARRQPASFSLSFNDYGFELVSAAEVDWPALLADGLFSAEHLLEDVMASLNAAQLAARRFREIARVAGLVFTGYPGERRSARQLQASAGLFYDVFRRHDPSNLLLAQAEREALELELDIARLRDLLERLSHWEKRVLRPPKPTPFAFPLLVGRLREQLSTEKLADRVARMLAELEAAAAR